MWPFTKKLRHRRGRLGQEIENEVVQRGAEIDIKRGFGYRLARYRKNGVVDHNTYEAVQKIGNKIKIDRVYAVEGLISRVADHANRNVPEITGILCHGTRNGMELQWFAKHFPDVEILGTEISETASQFQHTIQWDFHELHDDWHARWSVIYSNSWDHSQDPLRMFKTWSDSLAENGILYLEHNSDSLKANELDLFGATASALTKFVIRGSKNSLRLIDTIDGSDFGSKRKILVFRKG